MEVILNTYLFMRGQILGLDNDCYMAYGYEQDALKGMKNM